MHGNRVHYDEAYFLFDKNFFELLDALGLFSEVGGFEEDDFVKDIWVVFTDLFKSGYREAFFGVNVDDFLVFDAMGGTEHAEEAFSASARAVDGGNDSFFIASFQEPVEFGCSAADFGFHGGRG